MNIDTISIKGSGEWNEDALVMNEGLHIYGVLDGATSIHPYRGPNQETCGYLASACIKHYLEDLRAEEVDSTTLKQVVIQANKRLRDKMVEAGVNIADKVSLWTSALALIRVHDYSVDYAQVGDCMIAAVYEDKSVRVVSRDQVAHIDLESKRIWEEGIRNGITSREQLWEMVKPVIIKNKSRMNTIGGYSVLSGEPELADLVEYGTLNRINLKAMLMVTDGLFHPVERGSNDSGGLERLVQAVMEKSLSSYADWLISLEVEDSNCQKYPRFKVSDDKTAVWIQF
ncbi:MULTISPECIES: protein phosphatase 2C domain-containing protein [unclassified Paenibacillus]|uniref:protein phosphatase 2C domain-containing protein n=1 Tax=unclassified Paenibacillus TaxID=185978 RepID=UPI003638872E